MAPRVSQTSRAILRGIAELRQLENTLRSKVVPVSDSEAVKLRSIAVQIDGIIDSLETVGDRVASASGASIDEIKQKLSNESAVRRSGQLSSDDMCETEVQKGADLAGVMVALIPGKTLAEKMAIEGGEPAERLHVTLLYFVDKFEDREDWEKLVPILEKICAKHAKLSGRVCGAGRFVMPEKHVAWNAVDLPGINELRAELLEAAEKAGFEVSKSHSFTPHMTISYMEPEAVYPPVLQDNFPIRFNSVVLVAGDKKMSSAKLTGN